MFFIYGKFKYKKWNKLSPDKRLEVLQALENKLAREQNREPIPVRIHDDPNWKSFGMFMASGGKQCILVHEDLVYNPELRFHALETIIHEGRHASQFQVVNKKLKWYQFTQKRWQKNWKHYFSSSEDNVMYNNQAIERDAQHFTIKKLSRLSRKYRKERDFAYTLHANIQRYETAEDQARKKYGFFYKYKIDRNVKNKH